jgi:hypothetical protein
MTIGDHRLLARVRRVPASLPQSRAGPLPSLPKRFRNRAERAFVVPIATLLCSPALVARDRCAPLKNDRSSPAPPPREER